jgi:glycosyltransferase involved in cell wall biosynthesis
MSASDRIPDGGISHIVCIPVGRGELSLLSHTLQSVVSNTQAETEILVILSGIDWNALSIQEKTINLGNRIQWIAVEEAVEPCLFYRALSHLPTQYDSCDVILLLPGVEVPRGWDARLALAALQDENVASVSPLCDISPLFALLDKEHSRKTSLSIVDRLVYLLGQRHNIEVPALLCSCVYLRRPALNLVWPTLIANKDQRLGTFCWVLGKAFNLNGFHNVCCDHLYVMDSHAAHFREMEEIAAQEEVRLINQTHPLTGIRRAVGEALAENASKPVDFTELQPLQMHVVHSWGGGQERWLRDYCHGDTRRKNLVLRSSGTWGVFGKRITLYRSCNMEAPLRYWDLSYPIRSTVITHLQYKAILREIIDDFGIEVILVSSLIGHSLDALNTDIKTVFITHDYYPFCPAINIYFDGICEQCTETHLKRCFVLNDKNCYFNNVPSSEWLGIRKHFLKLLLNSSVSLVSPSESVPRHMKILIPELRSKEFEIIPHGVNLTPRPIQKEVCFSEKLRVIVLGSLVPHKGKQLLEEIHPELCDLVDFHLVGCGEDGRTFEGKPGIQVTPWYEYDQLSEIVAGIDPHIGLLLSIVPETYSYTLSELWLLDIPPVTTNLGSFVDRITDGVDGFVCRPDKSSIVEKINWLSRNSATLDRVKQRLIARTHRTVKEMVDDYHILTPLPEFSSPRYFLRRDVPRQVDVADVVAVKDEKTPVLLIDPKARFFDVARQFGRYALQKLAASPRFGERQKKLLVMILGSSFKLVGAVARKILVR